MKTLKRLELLKSLKSFKIVNDKAKLNLYEDFANEETLCVGKFPIFLERNFDYNTKEYLHALLISCHFGAKSSNMEASKYYLNRFVHVAEILKNELQYQLI